MESKQVKYALGRLSGIEPVTFGQPGQRTFRLDLHAGSAFCSVWMEKEQLFQLGVYLKDIVGALSAEDKARESHEGESNSFYVQAHERETEEDQQEMESVSFWITVAQAEALSEESLKICAAGRPTCFLCGQPINPEGHVCPRANGHTVLEAG